MIERDILELINAEIDGVNTPAESAGLRDHLQRNAEAGAWFEDWERIARAMHSAGLVEPPHGAIERVCASIPYQTHRTSSGHGRGFPHWFANVSRRPSVRFASGFATGAAVAVVLLIAVSREVDDPSIRSLDISDISGTIGGLDDARDFALVGSVDAQLANVDAALQLALHTNDDLLLADLELHSSTAIECVLSYDEAGVSFEGYRRSSGASQSVIAGQSETRISHRGDGHYRLFFKRVGGAAPSVTVRIYVAEALVFEETAAAGN